MKYKIFFLIFLTITLMLFSTINPPTNGQSFNIGDNVSFTWSPVSVDTLNRWLFPDKIIIPTGPPYSSDTQVHQVKTVGAYIVKAEWSTGTDSITINVIETRSITTVGTTYTAGTPIKFQAHDFSSPLVVRWVMGDGTNEIKTSNYSHTYTKPGTYTVKAYDFSGDTNSTPVTFQITVSESKYITVSPSIPYAGLLLTFTAVNFDTPNNIKWNMGDGTILSLNKITTNKRARILSGNRVQYTYDTPGNYLIKAYDNNGTQDTPVSLSLGVVMPNRQIVYLPEGNIRVDQPVYLGATGFLTTVIDWDFGDGVLSPGDSTNVLHRFQQAGTWIIKAKDSTINHTPIEKAIVILPENRSLVISAPEVRVKTPVQISALNFRGDLIFWDFGDGIKESSGHTVNHTYERGGTFTIKARDENGESEKEFKASVIVRGVSDELNIEIAEIKLDNGKYYKIVPKNSKEIRAVLKMKMRGTGTVSGYWLVDGNPFEFFNELSVQGELKEISTNAIPGLPTMNPGVHTVSVVLTNPTEVQLSFPVLRYFVLASETKMETLSPKDGFVVKEKEIPEFSWKEPKGGSKYKIGFSNYIYPLLMNESSINWVDVDSFLKYKPSKTLWNKISRNKWTYWKVKAFDTNGQFIAESDIQDIKVVIAKAEISLNGITDLDGNKVSIVNGIVNSNKKNLLVNGSIKYKGHSQYIVLRIYSGDKLIDQLLFRDVKKDEIRTFESSIPNDKKNTKIKFEVLKTSSPSVIIGIKGLILKNK